MIVVDILGIFTAPMMIIVIIIITVIIIIFMIGFHGALHFMTCTNLQLAYGLCFTPRAYFTKRFSTIY